MSFFQMKNFVKKHRFFSFISSIFLCFLIWFLWPIKEIFRQDYSRLILDREGNLLRAYLSSDQQYRFPPTTFSLPKKYISAVLTYEDKRFYQHPGIDPLSLLRAAWVNIKAGRKVQGGSTIPMQLARLAHPKKRTYFNKLLECLWALKLNLHFSKQEILQQYAAHVPMGGNIVGVFAAAYHYFGKPIEDITWAEAALLAVLPNAPSLANFKENRQQLKSKRNRLLSRLFQNNLIDEETFELACEEPLPEEKRRFPFQAPHFVRFVNSVCPEGKVLRTTLDPKIQAVVEELANLHHYFLSSRGIANLSVLVVEMETAQVRAYLGSHNFYDKRNEGEVDGVQAFRSPGSLLKPFLVAKVLDRGPYTMQSKIMDVPTFYGTFVPQNASKKFSGLVSLENVLIHSLNVPAVRLLNKYGLNDFYCFLKRSGLKGLFRPPGGYGLTLILGGAEASLWELVQLYLALGNLGKFREIQVLLHSPKPLLLGEEELFSQGASWLVLEALKKLDRPGSEYFWQNFTRPVPVAWKTGTSYGQRDAWAIGINKQWCIGVWVGNFTGEENAELSGVRSAAPLLFSIFSRLVDYDKNLWFEEPTTQLKEVECCQKSGYPAKSYCPQRVRLKQPVISFHGGWCPFHQQYLIDKKTGERVSSLCWEGVETEWVVRFIVPPRVKEILSKSGHSVDVIPPWAEGAGRTEEKNKMEILYPPAGLKMFIPRDIGGHYEKIVLQAQHQIPATQLFWFLNGKFVGKTKEIHKLAVDLSPGEYTLTVQDKDGFSREVSFFVYKKEERRD